MMGDVVDKSGQCSLLLSGYKCGRGDSVMFGQNSTH